MTLWTAEANVCVISVSVEFRGNFLFACLSSSIFEGREIILLISVINVECDNIK